MNRITIHHNTESCLTIDFNFNFTAFLINDSGDNYGFRREDLQFSLRYMEKWDLFISRQTRPVKKPNQSEKVDYLLKKSYTRYLCKICSKEFKYESELRSHARGNCYMYHSKRYKCPYCGYNKIGKSNLYKHIRSAHPFKGGPLDWFRLHISVIYVH